MNHEVKETFKSEMLKALDDNTLRFLSQLDIEMHYTVPTTITISGVKHPLLNGVWRSQIAPSALEETIRYTIELFKSRGLPFVWCVDHRTFPANLGEALLKMGFEYMGPIFGYAIELNAFEPPMPYSNSVRIEAVNDAEALACWGNILQSTFMTGEKVTEDYCALLMKKGLTNLRPFRHFIGYLNDRAVGSSTLFLQDDIAAVYNVGVIPSARGSGVAKEMLLELLQTARGMGCKAVIGQTSPRSAQLLNKIGFQKLCDFQFYSWPPFSAQGKSNLQTIFNENQ